MHVSVREGEIGAEVVCRWELGLEGWEWGVYGTCCGQSQLGGQRSQVQGLGRLTGLDRSKWGAGSCRQWKHPELGAQPCVSWVTLTEAPCCYSCFWFAFDRAPLPAICSSQPAREEVLSLVLLQVRNLRFVHVNQPAQVTGGRARS